MPGERGDAPRPEGTEKKFSEQSTGDNEKIYDREELIRLAREAVAQEGGVRESEGEDTKRFHNHAELIRLAREAVSGDESKSE